jgi:hypothetical protein
MGALVVIWLLWLPRNDKVFSYTNFSLLLVIYRCTGMLFVITSLVDGEL